MDGRSRYPQVSHLIGDSGFTQATFENTGWRPNSIAVTGLKVETLRFSKTKAAFEWVYRFISCKYMLLCMIYVYIWYVYRCVYIYIYTWYVYKCVHIFIYVYTLPFTRAIVVGSRTLRHGQFFDVKFPCILSNMLEARNIWRCTWYRLRYFAFGLEPGLPNKSCQVSSF